MRDLSENTPVIPYGDSPVACNYIILPYMMRFFQLVEEKKSGVSEVLRVTWPMIIANWTSKLRQTFSYLFLFSSCSHVICFSSFNFIRIILYVHTIVTYIYKKQVYEFGCSTLSSQHQWIITLRHAEVPQTDAWIISSRLSGFHWVRLKVSSINKPPSD